MVDYTFAVLGLFIVLDVLVLIAFNKVPVFGYIIGLFSIVVGFSLAIVSWTDSTALGLMSLFTALMGALTCWAVAGGLKVSS